MGPDERLYFEQLRKTKPEVDQMVVEHTLFLQQMNRFGEWKKFKQTLNDVHTDLAEQGKIDSARLQGKAKVVYLWNKYKRVTAIAASIAFITAISITFLVISLSPRQKESSKVIELDKKYDSKMRALDKKINEVDNKITTSDNKPIIPTHTGTGFLIDVKGLMITNAHVVRNSGNIFVQNNKGEQFRAYVVRMDVPKDVAIIKIDDDRFKPANGLPYGISKSAGDIAEPIFTLGFPREEIVYGEGYLSARTGFNGDTLSCQITINANPGNSGGPVFNHNGQVIGILSSKETGTEGAVFAVQSKYIYQALDDLRKNSLYKNVKLSTKTKLSGMDKVQQVKKIEDFVFMVKGD
jgi:S1-C subfamily serine protease